MKKIFSIFLSLLIQFIYAGTNSNFVIVVPSFNNASFYERNLESIFQQSYPNFRVIYIDDASTDGTCELVKNWIEKHGHQEKVTLICNDENKGGLANIFLACHSCKANEIVCLVDGDDFLAHKEVLKTLSSYYANKDVWMTYGQFEHFPSGKLGLCAPFEPSELREQLTRELPWRSSHLKTFYAGLFHLIKEEDLKFAGSFFSSATDLAIMYPMLDMATNHAVFIPEILYCYNNQNPISHHRIRHVKQRFFKEVIKAKQKYPALIHLPLGQI